MNWQTLCDFQTDRIKLDDSAAQVDMVTCEGSYCGALGWIHGRHTGRFAFDRHIWLISMMIDCWIRFTITICWELKLTVTVRIVFKNLSPRTLVGRGGHQCRCEDQVIFLFLFSKKIFVFQILFSFLNNSKSFLSETRFGFHYRVDLVAGVVREGWVLIGLSKVLSIVNSRCSMK